MKFQWKLPGGAKVWKLLDQYKYVLIAIAVGIVLLLWPSGEGGQGPPADTAEEIHAIETILHCGCRFLATVHAGCLEELEKKLAQTLSQVEGAGKVTVTLTLKSGMEQVLASDRSTSVTERGSSVEEETVIINAGTGQGQSAVLLTQRYPTFQGALVVCEGGDDAGIRLLMTQAVSSLTGIGSDRITVCKGGGGSPTMKIWRVER